MSSAAQTCFARKGAFFDQRVPPTYSRCTFYRSLFRCMCPEPAMRLLCQQGGDMSRCRDYCILEGHFTGVCSTPHKNSICVCFDTWAQPGCSTNQTGGMAFQHPSSQSPSSPLPLDFGYAFWLLVLSYVFWINNSLFRFWHYQARRVSSITRAMSCTSRGWGPGKCHCAVWARRY